MSWRIEYARSVVRTLRRLSATDRQRLKAYLDRHVLESGKPRSTGKPLKGQLATLWRYRVGDLRVICDIRDDVMVVLVVRVGHRGSIY